MALKSFKDVGVKAVTKRNDALQRNRSQDPIGIKTPLELGTSRTMFAVHFNIKDQIQDNLRNLLLTNWGERVALYSFGANLRPLLTEFTSKDDFDAEAMVRINTAINRWMPFVTPLGFESVPDYQDNEFTGKIRIILAYGVPSLSIDEEVLELTLHVI